MNLIRKEEPSIIDKDERKRLTSEVVRRVQNKGMADDEEINEIIIRAIIEYSSDHYMPLSEKKRLRLQIFASMRGLDVLQELIEDPQITEIMVNGSENIFVEQAGAITKKNLCFDTREKLDDVVQKIAAGSNRIINESSPIVDARLPDGSRVNMILPPIAINGPVVTIRKFPLETMTIEKLISYGSITVEAAEFLKKLVIAGYNIFVSGGTGSGKTTFLNALSNFIPTDQRVITIEDSAELQLRNIPNLVSLEVRNANVEGKNEISIRDLIKCSLRMRPDRIIVGEVRDAACIDMLQALNTGHSGMSTGHANSTVDILSRLETMVLLGADIPLLAVRRQIASAIDIIIQLSRFRDKSRKVVEITEVAGFENNEVVLNPCFRFVEKGEEKGRVVGELEKVGEGLRNREKLISAGLWGI